MADINTTRGARFFRGRRLSLFGFTFDHLLKGFFGTNALVSILVLSLITIFLFKEGIGFFGDNRDALRVYRQSGQEYVDIVRGRVEDHSALNRFLGDIRKESFVALKQEGLELKAINTRLAAFDKYRQRFRASITPLRTVFSEMVEDSRDLKERWENNRNYSIHKRNLEDAGKFVEASEVKLENIDFARAVQVITDRYEGIVQATDAQDSALRGLIGVVPDGLSLVEQKRIGKFSGYLKTFIASSEPMKEDLQAWDGSKPVGVLASLGSYIFGTEWVTASSWQDWYGLLPLLTGSLMISFIALVIAIPFGIGAAIYVNQMATPLEQHVLKPYIEFIQAIPSVVLGFFGIVVLGETLRQLSGQSWLEWIPGFPMQERLNALTAGCLLALMSIPTIFTLSEDALNNVPRSFSEASFALGASKLQTVLKIIVPSALSGMVAAILLGLGRVIGETMVVLLCAGNRIMIPDFGSHGIGAVLQPVHTMTGIIAQELGEVEAGSTHYSALFIVGVTLFFITLVINFFAQKIVHKYKVPTN